MVNKSEIIKKIVIEMKGSFPDDGNLVFWGEMDSLDFEELLLNIEKEFEITIPDSEFKLENFINIDSLEKLIDSIL